MLQIRKLKINEQTQLAYMDGLDCVWKVIIKLLFEATFRSPCKHCGSRISSSQVADLDPHCCHAAYATCIFHDLVNTE